MNKGSWVWDRDQQKLVPKSEFYKHRPQKLRSDFPTPMLSKRWGQEVWNPTNGKHYDGLRDYEKAIPKGQHIVEQGEWNEGRSFGKASPQEAERTQREIEQTVADSWDQIESGYKQ